MHRYVNEYWGQNSQFRHKLLQKVTFRFQNPGKPLFRPVESPEGPVDNAVETVNNILYNQKAAVNFDSRLFEFHSSEMLLEVHDGLPIPLKSVPFDGLDTGQARIRYLPEGLPGVHIGDVNLHRRNGYGFQGIQNRHGGKEVAAEIAVERLR